MSGLTKKMTAMAMAAALALPMAGVLPIATAMIVSAPMQANAQTTDTAENEELTAYEKCVVREVAFFGTPPEDLHLNCSDYALN